MKLLTLLGRAKTQISRMKRKKREEFIDFAASQFKELKRRNLNIPVTLFHL